jgi:cell division protein FtsI (penicillin-binding protein 3)
MSLPPVGPERRYNAMLAGVLAVLALFGARLVYLQGLEGSKLAAEAREARIATTPLQAVRGEIVDSAGVVLATSVTSYDIIVDQRQVPKFVHRTGDGDDETASYGAAAAARLLAPLLGMRVNELGARLVGERGYVRLVRDATPETWQKVRALDIDGITAERKSERVYPNGNTAGNILGFVDWEGTGQAGLELTLEDRLAGRPGTESVEIGAAGQVIPTGARSRTDAVPGQTVHLTIDRDIQWTAQHVVDATVDRYGAQWGAVLVEEVGTGRILALADSDAVDPNDPAASPEDGRGSRAVQNVYEPGSTGKIATVASAVEEGLVTPTSPFTVPYHYTTENGQTFKDHTEHPTLQMTTAGILAESSNTGTIQIGQLMSDQTRYDYLRRFGLGEQTHLGLPGESAGIVHRPEDWDGRMRYTVMFGQGIAVNLVQNTGVLATLANGGVHVEPRLVDGYTEPDGSYAAVEPPGQRQVVSAETAAEMIRMMESVVEDGTGTKAAISGYRVAGKTGTAQVADGGGGLSATVASFVGVVPAEAPRLAVGVVIYKPSSGFFGGTIAAPVFHDVASFALERLGVAPSTAPPDPFPLAPPGAPAAD